MSGTSLSHKQDQFTEVYALYYSSLFSVIYSKTGHFSDTEDICQEVFTRFYLNMEDIRNPRAWLYGTMRNVVFDYYKEKGRSAEEIEELMQGGEPAYENGFRESRMIIREILDEPETFSSEQEREIFQLVAVHEFSLTKAGRHTGLAYHTARKGFLSGMRRVVRKLKDRGIKGVEDLL